MFNTICFKVDVFQKYQVLMTCSTLQEPFRSNRPEGGSFAVCVAMKEEGLRKPSNCQVRDPPLPLPIMCHWLVYSTHLLKWLDVACCRLLDAPD